MQSKKRTKSISWGQTAGYAAVAFPLSLMTTVYFVYLPTYYAKVFGASLTSIGIALFAARVWDAITDPVIGILSDRTPAALGRRKPWVVGGAVVAAIAFYYLLSPPFVEPFSSMLWFTLMSFVFFLAWTALAVPYEAWGAELSKGFSERTRILGTRDGALILGTLGAAIIPYAIATSRGETDLFNQGVFGTVAGIVSVLLLLLTVPLVTLVPQRSRTQDLGWSWQNTRGLLRNGPYRVLLTSYAVSAFGAALPASLMFLYSEDVLGSTMGPVFLLSYLGLGILTLPLWIKLSDRFGKRNTWVASMLLNAGAFLFVPFLSRGDEYLFLTITIVSALGFGGTFSLPSSMQADVIDYEELRSGQRREGEMIGFWAVVKKGAGALGAGLAFPALDFFSFSPGTANTPAALWALALLYAGVPCVANLSAALLALNYPIDSAYHNRISAGIERRQAHRDRRKTVS